MAKEHYDFPSNLWDENNERAKSFFNKCYEYSNTLEDMLSLFDISIVYYILSVTIIIYFLVTFILIILFRKNYKILNNSILLSLYFSVGGLIDVVNSFLIQVNI